MHEDLLKNVKLGPLIVQYAKQGYRCPQVCVCLSVGAKNQIVLRQRVYWVWASEANLGCSVISTKTFTQDKLRRQLQEREDKLNK